ncbi:MAG: hypothetical protein IM504_06245 [Microcystis sp. M038S2]|jgi:hypothetical protein|uniref:hypothetical protein n=1 Tax=unclassified Microcystis TaxID=2643300 RepID=UPI001DFEEB98|nr:MULTISPECIES: hypothetical protein [unclassified Microcystis]MCA2764623.1 hypothetical protein [Microcystis sp. M151S2]NCR15544.1 hypothetical protein [Microcystis aeruginosa SX13-11]NCR20005.1 hypothetical protein [Microcystis aeruginosa LL13-03]NCR21307.1 hypothetical protein [Microcystis aeruginosa L111-01]NCR46797.1 hypothetical protein [Microcystis aeruginosa SX13-01]NCR69366.1 hypothetical protein [Microcystis aeruginosa LL11-07]NCR91982.1 hypothetical protein [Microcystis aeruginos
MTSISDCSGGTRAKVEKNRHRPVSIADNYESRSKKTDGKAIAGGLDYWNQGGQAKVRRQKFEPESIGGRTRDFLVNY